MFEFELAIDGDRVVDRLEDRPALLLQFQQAPAEGLVVVDEIEVVAPGAQMTPRSQTERHRFGEVAGAERDVFGDVGPVLPFPDARLAHRVGVAPDVEAGKLDQRNPLVEDRVRRAAQDLDMVAEVDQRLAEVADVDALTADMRLAAIGEQRNT